MNTTSDNITDTAGPKAIVATASANDLTTTLVVWLAIVSIVLGSLVVLVVYLNRRIRVVSEQLDEVTRQVANLPKTAPVLPKREKEIVTIDDVEGAEGLMTRVNAELSVAVGGQNVVGTAEHLMPLLSDVGHPPASPPLREAKRRSSKLRRPADHRTRSCMQRISTLASRRCCSLLDGFGT